MFWGDAFCAAVSRRVPAFAPFSSGSKRVLRDHIGLPDVTRGSGCFHEARGFETIVRLCALACSDRTRARDDRFVRKAEVIFSPDWTFNRPSSPGAGVPQKQSRVMMKKKLVASLF